MVLLLEYKVCESDASLAEEMCGFVVLSIYGFHFCTFSTVVLESFVMPLHNAPYTITKRRKRNQRLFNNIISMCISLQTF